VAEPKTRDEVIAIADRIADETGIPRRLLRACGIAEGNLRWNARRPKNPDQDAAFWPDVSGGAWQQTVRYDPDYRGGSAYPGPAEVERILALQYDVERSARVAARQLKGKWNGEHTDDAFLRAMYLYNWPAGGGEPYTPEHEANYRRGLEEESAIGGDPPVVKVTYNPAEPAHIQEHDYDCSQDAGEWMLWSVGRRPTENWMHDTMIAEGVMSPALGLLDASGAGMADFLRRHYSEFGYGSTNEPLVTFNALASEAGRYPIMFGGRAWGHWSGLKQYDSARDLLILANPSPGWKGVQQTMDRAQFDALGSFSLVRLTHPDLLAVVPPPVTPPPPTSEVEQLRAENAALKEQVSGLVTALAVVCDDVGDAHQREVDKARSIRAQFLGPRPAA
jgi:hypothetical protein